MSSDQYVSVVEPLTPAIDRVKTVLFRPFDLGKWFIIGFCAWLAYLGKKAGGGGGGNPGGGNWGGSGFKDAFFQAKEYVLANLAWILPLVIFGFALMIAIWLLILWLSSRGRFMFLHCVATNKAEVKVPWHKYARQASSLLAFRIVLALIGFFALIGPIVFVVILILGMVSAGAPTVGGIVGGIFIVFAIGAISLFLGLVTMFTVDFVIPIMFMRMTTCREAWRELLALMGANKGKFVVYILFKIVINMAIGAVMMAIICATCCCAACLMSIPYLGTVLFLPVLVFQRSYPLYYIKQYGVQYDIFATVESVAEPV